MGVDSQCPNPELGLDKLFLRCWWIFNGKIKKKKEMKVCVSSMVLECSASVPEGSLFLLRRQGQDPKTELEPHPLQPPGTQALLTPLIPCSQPRETFLSPCPSPGRLHRPPRGH